MSAGENISTDQPSPPAWLDDAFRERVRSACARLCFALAPHDIRRCYVVWASEIPGLSISANVTAFTGVAVDLFVRPHIGDRWQGRGFAFVVDDLRIAGKLECDLRDMEPTANELRELFFLGCVRLTVHELAHEVERERVRREEDEPGRLVAGVADWIEKAKVIPPSGLGAPLPFASHGWTFHRAVLHLVHRAQRLGRRVTLDGVFAFSRYGISDAADYAFAIGDEPERLQDASFAEIRATPIPAAFAALWRRDFLAWLDQPGLSAIAQQKLNTHFSEFVISPAAVQQEENHDRVARKSHSETDGTEEVTVGRLVAACP